MARDRSFYVTFGQQYRDVGHPSWRPAHPDGWLRVIAPDEYKARLVAHRWLGPQWAFLYDEDEFEKTHHYYPKGELGVATENTIQTTPSDI